MLKPVKQLYELLTLSEKRYLVLLAFLLTAMAVFQVIGVASVMPFLAIVGDSSIIESNRWLFMAFTFIGASKNQFIIYCGFASLGMLLIANTISFLATWALLRFTHMFNYNLSLRMFKLYLLQPYNFFLNNNSNEMGKNVLDEVMGAATYVVQPLLIVVSRTFIVTAMLAFMLVNVPGVSFFLYVCLGGCYVALFVFTRRVMVQVGRKRTLAQSGRFRVAGETFGSIKAVKSGGHELFFYDQFDEQAMSYARQGIINEVVAAGPRQLFEVIAFGSIILIILYFFMSGKSLAQILPLMGMYALGGMKILPALQQIFAAVTNIRFYTPTLDLLYQDFKRCKKTEGSLDKDWEELPFNEAIALKGVSFAYSPEGANTLQDLDLTISKGEMVGFVGTTGAGKTTTIDILLALLAPGEGQLLVDGVPITQDNVRTWHRRIGYVPQAINLMDDSVRMNIAFGLRPEEVDEQQVLRAAKIANIHDHIVKEMPEGYDSIVGEHGARLSGGQQQRLGIARALYRDPDILIFDEATSALDEETESRVMESIETLADSKTIIMIAHRTSTLRKCDRIFIFERGRVAEVGTYEDLLAK